MGTTGVLMDNDSRSPASSRPRPPAQGAPVLRLIDALRAGQSLDGAASAADLPVGMAKLVAAAPLAQALIRL